MKDLSLSLLSRGCGRFISSNGNTGRHDGRLDVCFTPQDYYIWKSQDSLLQLSNRGRLLVEAESTLPKTYSTRRGPLLLYSQDLVTIDTNCHSETRDKKKRVVRRYTQHVEQQLSTLKELTAAILSYSNNQFTSYRLGPPFFPPLRLPFAPDRHRPSPPPIHTTREQSSPELLVQLNSQWLPAERNTEQLENPPEDEEKKQGNRKRVRLDLFLQIPCTSRSPTPQMEPQPSAHYTASTSEEEAQPRWEGPSSDEHHAQPLPPISDSVTVVPERAIQAQNQKDSQTKAERAGFQSHENLNRLHQQHLFLPLLFPGKEGVTTEKQKGEKTETQYYRKETLGQGGRGGGGRPRSGKGSMILLEPGEEPPPPLGVLGCVTGWKGPGKQSSLAFIQNQLLDLQDPCESSNANRGVVRGILPLELRDLQDGKSVGTLILGPDGEIMQLSLYDNSQDPSQADGDKQDQALQVLSAEGEKLPWVIVLQPGHTHIEDGSGLNKDVPVADILHEQSTHKLLNLQRVTETCSPSSHTDPVAVTKKKTKRTQAVTKTLKTPKKDAKNNVRMPPLRERVGKEEPRGDHTEADEEDEEEELGSTGQISHLPESHEPGQKLQFKDDVLCSEQNNNPNDATIEDAVDKKRKNTERKDVMDAAIPQGKRDMKKVTSAESDGQKMRRKGRWQRQKTGGDAQSSRSQREEERNVETVETQDLSTLPSKKMTDREAVKGEVKINEKKEERVVKQKEESAARRKRGRLKYKEVVVGNHEKEEVEIYQDMKEESHLKSTKWPSATQRHKTKTKSNSEEDVDTDHLSTNADKHSSVRSVSSLRSTAAASPFNHRSLRRSTASSCEGAVPASTMGLASSHGRLSSCSTVMITEEQLMLNPVKPESSRPRKNQEEEEAAALRLGQRAERRRQEVERKRREREEEERKQQEREQTEERMRSELEEERRKRAEEFRLKRMAEEEEKRKREEEEQERARREQAQRERERRRQEERRRQMERLQRMREEEEKRRKAELERLRLEEERRQEEELKKLQEMDESERIEYLLRKEKEEEEKRKKEEEHKRVEEEAMLRAAEEARLQAGLLTRQMALLQQQLAFKRGLMLEAGGLEKTQGISRPWIYSYFTLLQLLGLNPTKAETITP